MTIKRAAIFAALFLWASVGRVFAEDVTLTSRDGSVEIVGTLLGYDGELYRVDTVYGVLTVDGSGVVCDGPGCPDLQAYIAEFTISGAKTMGEVLLPALVEAYGLRNGYSVQREIEDDAHFRYVLSDKASGRDTARIGFRVSSTAEGFADLIAGEADIALAMRQATIVESRLAKESGAGDLKNPRRSRIIGFDAIIPIVAYSNPIEGLTLQGLARVFAGEVDSWAALGGMDAPIALHLRDDHSGLTQEFRRRVLRPFQANVSPTVTLHASNSDLADAVARNPLAIGVAAYSDIGNAKPISVIGVCGKHAVASAMSLKTEDYPLTAPLFVYTPARRLPIFAREFLAYLRSPVAQPVIGRAGFVDLRLQELPVVRQGNRLANAITAAGGEIDLSELQRLVKRLNGTKQLSLAFRFELGGTKLDAQSRSNVEILAQKLERGEYDGRKLVFAGFSDGAGPAAANMRLARRRAESVRRAVLRAAPTADTDRLDLQVDAFGEAMPLACDDVEWGRHVNRRVEVWVGQR